MMEEAATFPEAPQIRALIRGLRSDTKLSELEAKYPLEKLALLDVVNVLTGFCYAGKMYCLILLFIDVWSSYGFFER